MASYMVRFLGAALLVFLLSPVEVYAQASFGRGLIGMSKGALHLGGDYESRSSSSSFGGYFFYQTEGKDAGIQQFMTGGAYMPIHLLQKNRYDAYISPGLGIGMVKVADLAGEKNEMILGPSFKIGGEYRTSSKNSFGLQYHTYFNWMSKKVALSAGYASFVATFGL